MNKKESTLKTIISSKDSEITGGLSSARGNDIQTSFFSYKIFENELNKKTFVATPHVLEDIDIYYEDTFSLELFQVKTKKANKDFVNLYDIQSFLDDFKTKQIVTFMEENELKPTKTSLCINVDKVISKKQKKTWNLNEKESIKDLLSNLKVPTNNYFNDFNVEFINEDSLNYQIKDICKKIIKDEIKDLSGWSAKDLSNAATFAKEHLHSLINKFVILLETKEFTFGNFEDIKEFKSDANVNPIRQGVIPKLLFCHKEEDMDKFDFNEKILTLMPYKVVVAMHTNDWTHVKEGLDDARDKKLLEIYYENK